MVKPPRSLVGPSFRAAFAGKGSAARGSLGIRLKDGRGHFVRLADQLGREMLDSGTLVSKLRAAGVREIDAVREVRSLGFAPP